MLLFALLVCSCSKISPLKNRLPKLDRKIMLKSVDEPLIYRSGNVADGEQAGKLFNQYCEVLNGRLAMFGFTIGMLKEEITGESFMEQLGLNSHDDQMKLLGFLATMGVFSVISRVLIKSKTD